VRRHGRARRAGLLLARYCRLCRHGHYRIGALAVGQRHYYTASAPKCSGAGTVVVTVLFGYIWNLAVEQHSHWHPGRKGAPGYLEQCRQLTQARAEHPWPAADFQTVQQQALRDFAQAMNAFVDPANPPP
jgi:hypothetical protein